MWELYLDSKTWGVPPSQRLKVRPLRNDWAAYQFDAAVLYVGMVVENALAERRTVGKESLPKYSLADVLEPDFRLSPKGGSQGGIKAMAAAHPSEVGRWKQVPKAV